MASAPCWRAVRSTLMIRPWVTAPAALLFPPYTFLLTTAGLIACSPRQFVASQPCSRNVNRASSASSRARCATNRRFGSCGWAWSARSSINSDRSSISAAASGTGIPRASSARCRIVLICRGVDRAQVGLSVSRSFARRSRCARQDWRMAFAKAVR